MNDLNMNSLVNYDEQSDSLYCGDWENITYPINYDWYTYPIVREYYPIYCSYPIYEDKYKKAFNIAKLLLKNNWLISRKLKDFIGLVEEIEKEL